MTGATPDRPGPPSGVSRTRRLAAQLPLLLTIGIIGLLVGQTLHLVSESRSGNAIQLFDFGAEANLPTIYTVFLLWIAAQFLALIAWATHRNGGTSVRHWAGLAVIFLFLAVDESAGVHELIGSILKRLDDGETFEGGVFHYAWSLLYLVGVIALGLLYLRFLLGLPRGTRIGFIAAGGLFLLGALGIELAMGGRYERLGDPESLAAGERLFFDLVETLEELLEMVGLVVFIATLQRYFGATFPHARLELGTRTSTP